MHTVWMRALIMAPAPTDMLIHTLVPHTMHTTEHKLSYPNYGAQALIYVLHAKMLIGLSTKAYTDLHNVREHVRTKRMSSTCTAQC